MAKAKSTRQGKYQFVGKLSDFQKLEANSKSFMKYEQDKYTAYQNYLYKRALYGLKSLSKEEFDKTCKQKRKRISRVYLRGQKVINIFKQQVANVYANKIFSLFPSCKFIVDIPPSEIDRKNININTLKELGINYDDLVLLFMQKNLLPKNFFNII